MRVSGWMGSFLGLLLASGAAHANHDWDDDDYDDDDGVFLCESYDMRHSYCDVDGYGSGDVVLVNQISRNACIEGSTWGADGRGVWVSDGCRGEFAIVDRHGGGWGSRHPGNDWPQDGGRYGGGLPNPYPAGSGRGGAYAVRCESRDHGYSFCALPIRGNVDIQQQLSDAPCEYGETWGYDQRGIWVDGGCRADFVVGQ